MTYQPKSYRKFVATAATATLVATAFAPFASAHSFKDVETKYEEAVNFLVSKGVSGYPDGTFKTQKTITRLEAAEMLGKALGLDKVTDAPVSGFTDVPARVATLINAFKAKGITSGKTATTFAPNAEITRGELAVWIQKAYDLKAKEGSTNKFTDVADNYKAAVQAFVDNKIASGTSETTFGTTTSAKRGDFALFVKRAADAAVVKEVAVESVSAINAKTLKVTFNKAVKDTTKAVFEVKKGSVKVNTSSITWNEAKTEATIELSGKLSAGEYTVNVTGLTETALTGKVTAENEKVASIELLAESAPLATPTTAAVGYKVVNQYGEDITSTTSLMGTASGASVENTTANVSKGVATITVKSTAKEGDAFVLTLVHTDSGVSTSKTIKVAAKAAVSEVAIKGLYNKDNKTLTETTDLSKDAFYLIVEGKDQYGSVAKLAALNGAGLILNNTNTTIAGVSATNSFETIQVDGKDVTALRLTNPSGKTAAKAGSTDVMLIAPVSGKNATFKIEVAESQRVDTITFEVPSVVAAKEDLYIPVQATDKSGKAVTDEKILKDAARGVTLSGVANPEFTTKDGVLSVKIPAASLQNTGYVSLVGVTATAKTAIVNIQVKAAAEPTIVTGLTAKTSTTLLVGSHLDISDANLVVEDQYGRVMTEEALGTWLGANAANKIIVEDTTAGVVTLASGNSTEITAAKGTARVTGAAKGTEKVTIKIANAENKSGLATSAKEVTFQVTDGTEYVSYQVEQVGTVYDEDGAGKNDDDAYDKEVKVYGLLSNGSKVLLTYGTDYSVSSTNATLNEDVASDGVIDVEDAYTYAQGQTEVKVPLTVTINATGEKLNQEVTISKVAPKVTKLEIVKKGDVANTTMTATSAITYTTAAAFDFSKLAAAVDVVVTDQYGVKTELVSNSTGFADGTAIASTLTFTKVDGNLVFANNGSGTASVKEIPANSIFNVVVSAGELTSSPLKVTVTTGYSTTATNQADLAAVTAANVKHTINEIPFASNDKEKAKAKVTETIETALTSISAASGVTFEIVDENFTPAVGSTTQGTYKFKVKYTKGTQTLTSSEYTVKVAHS